MLQLVKPRHFLPVHGEASFLYAHAELAQDLGCRNTTVIRNGQMLGVGDIRSREHVSMGTAAVRPPSFAPLSLMYSPHLVPGMLACCVLRAALEVHGLTRRRGQSLRPVMDHRSYICWLRT